VHAIQRIIADGASRIRANRPASLRQQFRTHFRWELEAGIVESVNHPEFGMTPRQPSLTRKT
jgi:hypothetical protein